MYPFEGNRRRHNVALGGRSRTGLTSADVVYKAAQARQKRKEEKEARQQRAVVTLQRAIQSFLQRKQNLREIFEKEKKPQNLVKLTRYLCFFYNEKKVSDFKNLTWLLQEILKSTLDWMRQCSASLRSQILIICCRALQTISSKDMDISLQAMKVLTQSTYWGEDYIPMWRMLVNNGFFISMMRIIDVKVPHDLDPSHAQNPDLDRANSFLRLLVRPVAFDWVGHFYDDVSAIFEKFFMDVLSHPMNHQIYNFLLPSLRNMRIITAASLNHLERKITTSNTGLRPNLSSLASLVKLLDGKLEHWMEPTTILTIIDWLVPTLYCKVTNDERSGVENYVGVAQPKTEIETRFVDDFLLFLNSEMFINFTTRCPNKRSVSLLGGITFHLMVYMELQIESNRLLNTLALSTSFVATLCSFILDPGNFSQITEIRVASTHALLKGNHMTKLSMYQTLVSLITFNLHSLQDEDSPGEGLPNVVLFKTKFRLFTKMLNEDRLLRESDRNVIMYDEGNAGLSNSINLAIRRDYIYVDSFDNLSGRNAHDLHQTLNVRFINEHGVQEQGYGPGVIREFYQQLMRTSFHPELGLFKLTDDGELYPNPYACHFVDDMDEHFYFLGQLLGKVIYEEIQIDLPFAAFFLRKLLKPNNTDVDIYHLQSLDRVLYRSLMLIIRENNVDDLDLNFTIVDNILGTNHVTELVPGGGDLSVTKANCARYIQLVSDYKLNTQMRVPVERFQSGLFNVISLEFLQMFHHRELQTIISGTEVAINIVEMKDNTVYDGGYTAEHPTIQLFWKVLRNFTEDEKRKFLCFVTSCSRPPLLGFQEMDPPFCIDIGDSLDHLPTASTCGNRICIPQYLDYTTMREKILYCINSRSGFELF